MPESCQAASRQMASTVAEEKAKQLHNKSMGFMAIARLLERAVKEETISKQEEGWIWSILIDRHY